MLPLHFKLCCQFFFFMLSLQVFVIFASVLIEQLPRVPSSFSGCHFQRYNLKEKYATASNRWHYEQGANHLALTLSIFTR